MSDKVTSLNFKHFCSSGFIADYINYAEPLTDAPVEFHIATAICTLSTAMSNKIFLPLGDKRLYPNVWALVLAPSGTHRKSSSIQIGLNLIRDLDRKLLLPRDFSIEAFLEGLSENPTGILAFSEFAALLEMGQRSYMIGLRSILTDLYDCPPWFTRKLKGKEFTIENACFSLIGASTIDWLIESLKEGDVKGGFLARFLFFPSSRKTKILPIPPRADEYQKSLLVAELKKIQRFAGECSYSEGAKDVYDDWYRAHDAHMQREVQLELLSSFYNRIPDYLWKISMLISVSVEGTLTISAESVSKGVILVEYLKQSIKTLVEEEFEFSKEGRNKKKLFKMAKDYLEKHNRVINHSTLLRNSHMNAKELKEAANALVEEGRFMPPNGDTCYWPTE